MAEKGVFVTFVRALKKDFIRRYPFMKQMETSLDPAIPKSSSLYLGISPRFNKHVVVNFFHMNKSRRVGEFNIRVHISTEYEVTKNWDAPSDGFLSFYDGLYF